MPTMITVEIKYGIYVIICTVFLYALHLTTLRRSANTMVTTALTGII